MLHFARCTFHAALYTLYFTHCNFQIILYILSFRHCALDIALYTLQFTHHTLHTTLYIIHFKHCTLYITLYTLHILLYEIRAASVFFTRAFTPFSRLSAFFINKFEIKHFFPTNNFVQHFPFCSALFILNISIDIQTLDTLKHIY